MDTPPAPDPAFTVLRQDHQASMDPTDPGSSYWTVTFRTPSRVESFVTVPQSEYTAENVRALILDQVRKIEAVHSLGDEPGS